ncbi:MAG: ketopantoate reductase family protein [Turneriella sp.]|nr:ketopantoate reductase family protein [Turneriella sp.]
MQIAFLGTGAIGASLVRALYLNKIPFTILVRDKKRKLDLLTRGISYRLKDITHVELAGDEVRTVGEAKKYDYIFMGMKTPNLRASAATAKKHLTKNGKIILLQNGLPEGAITGYKSEQIISGIVGYNTQLMNDGSYFQSNPGHLILGVTAPTVLAEELKTALEPHQPVRLTHNPVGFRWNKLAINSVINGLGAVTGLALGPLFARRDARRAAITLIQEAAAVMKALRIEEGIVPGAISVYKLAGFPKFLQHLIIYILGRKYAKIRTSMLQDIDKGVKTEVDEIHGAIVAAAKTVGIAVPLTSQIVARVHALETGKTKPNVDALQSFFGR